MFDILIKGGSLLDGTGMPAFKSDVGILADRIVAIGELDSSCKRIIDADGCAVSPGFIDIHSHTDETVFVNQTSESKVTQGVTTEICGNCGCSPFPRNKTLDEEDISFKDVECNVEADWHSAEEYFTKLEQFPKTVNQATLVGHGSVRAVAMGYENRLPKDNELTTMKHLVEDAMRAGAFGLSSGLIYSPGIFASTEELIELCKIVARYNGVYATHMRSEGSGLFESLRETVRIGRESSVKVQISHLKALGRENWGKAVEVLGYLDAAIEEGMEIRADQYPYTATSTSLKMMLPAWAHEGGVSSLLARLRDTYQRNKLRDELYQTTLKGWIGKSGGWNNVIIGSVKTDKNRFCEGMSIENMAELIGKHPVDTVLDLLDEEDGSVGMMHFIMNESDVMAIMKHPAVLVGSDATARSISGHMSKGKPHPRSFGTFPRVLGRYSRAHEILSLEEAISKMTGKSAMHLGLHKRGILAVDNYADITIFDPVKIEDTSTFERPHNITRGIRYVLVNGEVVIDDGELIDLDVAAPGKVLRRGFA